MAVSVITYNCMTSTVPASPPEPSTADALDFNQLTGMQRRFCGSDVNPNAGGGVLDEQVVFGRIEISNYGADEDRIPEIRFVNREIPNLLDAGEQGDT